jgi:hypothetical protein
MELYKHVLDKTKEQESQPAKGDELIGQQSGQEVNLDDQAINAQELSHQTVAKL